jgi:hypothetical protein
LSDVRHFFLELPRLSYRSFTHFSDLPLHSWNLLYLP